MAKTKKLIFQDVDFDNKNRILNPSSIENANSSIIMSDSYKESDYDPDNVKSKIKLSSDKISLIKVNNSITLEQSKVVVSSNDFRVDGALRIGEVHNERFLLNNESVSINNIDYTVNATSKSLSVQGPSNLKIESTGSDSNIVSDNMDAKKLAKAKKFSVDGQVSISWDNDSKSLIFEKI